MHVVDTLAPIFILVALGSIMRRIKFLPEEFFNGVNKLTFYVGLPVLLFHKIALANFAIGDAGKILATMAFGMTAAIPLGYILARVLRLPRQSVGTFVQSCFRCNMAYVGLPVILYAFAGRGEQSIGQLATLSLAPLVPYTNVLSIAILARKDGGRGGGISGLVWKSVSNPIVIGCVVALPLSYFAVPLPKMIERSCDALGSMALPLALISIGSSLTFDKIRGNIVAAAAASVVNIFALPALGWIAAAFLGMNGTETMIALILLACPAASSSYVMVQQLGGDEALAGSTIVISTLLSIIPLTMIVAFFGPAI